MAELPDLSSRVADAIRASVMINNRECTVGEPYGCLQLPLGDYMTLDAIRAMTEEKHRREEELDVQHDLPITASTIVSIQYDGPPTEEPFVWTRIPPYADLLSVDDGQNPVMCSLGHPQDNVLFHLGGVGGENDWCARLSHVMEPVYVRVPVDEPVELRMTWIHDAAPEHVAVANCRFTMDGGQPWEAERGAMRQTLGDL